MPTHDLVGLLLIGVDMPGDLATRENVHVYSAPGSPTTGKSRKQATTAPTSEPAAPSTPLAQLIPQS